MSGASNRSGGSSTAKPATGKTSRKNMVSGTNGRARSTNILQTQAAYKALLFFSVGATLIAAVLLIVTYCTPKKPYRAPQEPVTVYLSDEVKIGIQAVREQAQAALRKEPPVEAELIKANQAIIDLRPQLTDFEIRAKRDANYTDEQVGLVMEQCGWSSTNAMGRIIRDRLVQIKNQKK